MGMFTITPHKVKVGTAAGLAILTAEVAGFMIDDGRTQEINNGLLRLGGSAAEVVLDDGLERVGCFLVSVLPVIDYDGDCVQNAARSVWDSVNGEDSAAPDGSVPATEVSPSATSLPVFGVETTVPATTPAAPVETAAPEAPAYDYDLVANMQRFGYNCINPRLVQARDGDGPITLMVAGGTDSELANDAYEQGALTGYNVQVGEVALVGACS